MCFHNEKTWDTHRRKSKCYTLRWNNCSEMLFVAVSLSAMIGLRDFLHFNVVGSRSVWALNSKLLHLHGETLNVQLKINDRTSACSIPTCTAHLFDVFPKAQAAQTMKLIWRPLDLILVVLLLDAMAFTVLRGLVSMSHLYAYWILRKRVL